MLVNVRVIRWVQRLVLISNVNMSVNINRVLRDGSWRDWNVRISIPFAHRFFVMVKLNNRLDNGIVSHSSCGGLGNL